MERSTGRPKPLQGYMDDEKFPFEEDILNLAANEKMLIWIKGRAFIIEQATESDIERINQGFFCMD